VPTIILSPQISEQRDLWLTVGQEYPGTRPSQVSRQPMLSNDPSSHVSGRARIPSPQLVVQIEGPAGPPGEQ